MVITYRVETRRFQSKICNQTTSLCMVTNVSNMRGVRFLRITNPKMKEKTTRNSRNKTLPRWNALKTFDTLSTHRSTKLRIWSAHCIGTTSSWICYYYRYIFSRTFTAKTIECSITAILWFKRAYSLLLYESYYILTSAYWVPVIHIVVHFQQ